MSIPRADLSGQWDFAVARSRVRALLGASPTGLAESSSLTLRTGRSSQVALHPPSWERSYLFRLQAGNVRLGGTRTLLIKRLHRRTSRHHSVCRPLRIVVLLSNGDHSGPMQKADWSWRGLGGQTSGMAAGCGSIRNESAIANKAKPTSPGRHTCPPRIHCFAQDTVSPKTLTSPTSARICRDAE